MSSRGVYGFRRNGVDKITYSHSCSYPTILGESILKFIKSTPVEEMDSIFEKIIMINEENKPTKEQIEECKEYFDSSIRDNNIEDWYCLLRKSQGTLMPYKEDLKYMIDSEDFIKSSLQCEWGWIINLDTNQLEVYIGFQREIDDNRYSVDKPDNYGYYNCKLFKSISFNELNNNTMNDINEEYKILRLNAED